MADVTIDHPSTIGYAVVSEEAFEAVWEELGWVIVEEDPPLPPPSEQVATLADIYAIPEVAGTGGVVADTAGEVTTLSLEVPVVLVTETEYDALTPTAGTLYVVTEDP